MSSGRRQLAERRELADRRTGVEHRLVERRQTVKVVDLERRLGVDRRQGPERRGTERRGQETVAEHIRNALQLMTNVAVYGALDDEDRRDLDAAMFRLRFALDKLESGKL